MFLYPSQNKPFSARQNLAKGKHENKGKSTRFWPLTNWYNLRETFTLLQNFFYLLSSKEAQRDQGLPFISNSH